jgi:hypothetical protein
MAIFLNNVSSQPVIDYLMIDQEAIRHLRNTETIGPVFTESPDHSELFFLDSFLTKHSERILGILSARGQVAQKVTDTVDVSAGTVNKVL